MNPLANRLRAVLVGILGLLATTGLVPADVKVFIEQNADTVVGVILLVWSALGFIRNRKDRKDKEKAEAEA